MAPRLTILVPTFQRAFFVNFVLHRLIESVAYAQADDVEILVSDNRSTDGTQEVVAGFLGQYDFIRYYRQPEHYASGEENIFTALPQCRGEFVWTFSDDDIPEITAVAEILKVLDRKRHDFILMNPRLVSTSGETLAESIVPMSRPELELSIRELISQLGMINLSCCFSAVVFRRSCLEAVDWRAYMEQSPIYSHVVMYCEAFKDRSCLFLSKPLLRYRIAGTEEDAWKTRSALLKKPLRFPWSVGLVRLLRHAQQCGALPPDFLHGVVERDLEGCFLLDEYVLWQLTDQILIWIESGREYEAVTTDDIAAYMTVYGAGEQPMLDSLYKLRAAVQLWSATTASTARAGRPTTVGDVLDALPPELSAKARTQIRAGIERIVSEVRQRLDARKVVRRLGTQDDYTLYRVVNRHVAVHRMLDGINLTAVDLKEASPYLLIANSLVALQQRLPQQAGAGSGDDEHEGYRLVKRTSDWVAVQAGMDGLDAKTLPAAECPPLFYIAGDRESLRARIGSSTERRRLAAIDAETLRRERGKPVDAAALTAEATSYFDEAWYLEHYPDIRAGIAAKRWKDGLAHFLQEGVVKGYNPSPFFDEASYRHLYPAVSQFIAAGGWASSFVFWLHVGRRSGFPPSCFFDEAWYRARHPDVATQVASGELRSGFDHYLHSGWREGRQPADCFDPAFYLKAAEQAGLLADGAAPVDAFRHYLAVGQQRGLSPGPLFDEQGYLARNRDVADAVAAGHYRSGFHHWLASGRAEGRPAAGQGRS